MVFCVRSFLHVSRAAKVLCTSSLVAGALLFTMAGASGEETANAAPPISAQKFAIHGSNTIGARLMPAIVESYARHIGSKATKMVGVDPEQVAFDVKKADGDTLALIDIRSHGSGTAVPGLISGEAIIGMASRPITGKEIGALAAAGLPNLRGPEYEHVIGLDGILALVSKDNPVSTLTVDQLAQIFSGKITDWKSVGGRAGPINVYARDDKSGTYDTFNSLVLKPRSLKLRADATRFESSEELSDSVARDPNGIGFIGFAYLRDAKALTLAEGCGTAVEPTTFNVKTEEYPLSRRLYLYANALANGSMAADLLAYALSPDAREIVRESGYIDLEPELLATKDQTARLAQSLATGQDVQMSAAALKRLALDLIQTKRASITFYFVKGSSALDNKSAADIARVARLAKGLFDGDKQQQIVLTGFSDTLGDFAHNQALSLARAEQVKQAILKELGPGAPARMIVTRGYGELLPTSCNATEDGRNKNRRVEVWLK